LILSIFDASWATEKGGERCKYIDRSEARCSRWMAQGAIANPPMKRGQTRKDETKKKNAVPCFAHVGECRRKNIYIFKIIVP
jgi:hypothetical protein